MACFFIKSKMNELVLDIEKNKGSGSKIITYEKHGKDNQIWFEDPASGTIKSKAHKDCCLTFNGEHLIIKKVEPGNASQQWMRQGNTIRNRVDPNQVIDIYKANKDPGATVGAYKFNGKPNQQFEFIPAPGTIEGMTSPYYQGQKREFYIVSEMHGKVLDICEENVNVGAYLIVYEKNHEKKPNQLWYLDNLGLLRSALSDLTVSNKAKGERLVTAMPSVDPRSQWMIQGDRLISRAGECMDIAGEDKSNGAKVITFDSNGQANQKWRVEYA